MNKFVIITDSACDLPESLRERFDIPDYLHGIVYFPDGHEELADLDWGCISPEEFYNSMKGRNMLYNTSCATLGETEQIFEKYASQGIDILCIAMSSALSCTYQNCINVGRAVCEKYPERKIICVDSLRYSTSLALLVVLASLKRKEGATLEETAEYVENIKNSIHQMGPMDDLFFLVKKGRISNFKAFFGTLVGVNPMADFNRQGLATVLGKFKGKTAAFEGTIKYIEKTIVNPSEQIIFIAHSNREAAANTLAEKVKEAFNPKEIIITSVGMSCGAAIGPGLCAVFYVGTPISEDGKKEQEIMSEILNGTKSVKIGVTREEDKIMAEDKSFVLLTDSTSDLNESVRKEYGIEYVKMNYVIDGIEYPASLDWESHSSKEYYDLLRGGKHITTTQVPQDTYRTVFEGALSQGKDLIYIACSSALSGSINLANVVARELNEKYPDNKIYCIDSLCSSLGQGSMVIDAAKLRNEGKTAAEVTECIEANKLKVNQSGTVASLEYLRRAGRVTASKAFFGNLFGVKPLIISDIKGQNYAVKKAKGKANAYKEIANMVAESVEGFEADELYLSHADCLADIELLRDEILNVVPFKKVYIDVIGPIVGASVGPGTVISFCKGKEVTIEGKE